MSRKLCVLLATVLIGTAAFLRPQESSGELSEMAYIMPAEAQQHLLKRVDPIYPQPAETARIQGMVDLLLSIGEDGHAKLTVISGHPLLVPAAFAAVSQWTYKPFEKDGKPVSVTTTVALWIPANHHQLEVQHENEFLSTYWPAKTRGIAALDKGDFETANQALLVARNAAEAQGEPKWHEQAIVDAALGNAEHGRKDDPEAERFFKESLALYEKHARGDTAEAADAMEEFANVYAAQNKSDQAEPLLLHAVKIYKQGMKTASTQKDKTWYGRHLAVSSFWLVAIGTSSHRMNMAQAHCEDVEKYATEYVRGEQRNTMLKGCAEVASKAKE